MSFRLRRILAGATLALTVLAGTAVGSGTALADEVTADTTVTPPGDTAWSEPNDTAWSTPADETGTDDTAWNTDGTPMVAPYDTAW